MVYKSHVVLRIADDPSWPRLIDGLLRGQDLSTSETAWAMGEIVSGVATPAQIAAFAIALRAKPETHSEMTGLVEVMLQHAIRVELPEEIRRCAVDVSGTGGDGARTVNVSTMAAVVVAGTGVRVVKCGNRAASSACGAADLLEVLGVPLDMSPSEVVSCVTEAGIGFCFTPRFHPGMRYVAAMRRQIGVPTVFNFLGPLVNPAQPTGASVGCFDRRMAPLMAEVLARRGDEALIVRGEDGLDEFTTTAPTRIWAVRDGSTTEIVVDAEQLGMARARLTDLRGADAAFNATVARRVFDGESGPVRDIVLLNAAAGLAVREGWGDDLPRALRAGIEKAAASIDSGAAARVLARWVGIARSLPSRS